MTDSLFEAVALCSKELMKYSLSAEEFAVLAQKNGMTDSEILAVSKCKNRHPSPICTQFEHHFHALKPHLLCHSF